METNPGDEKVAASREPRKRRGSVHPGHPGPPSNCTDLPSTACRPARLRRARSSPVEGAGSEGGSVHDRGPPRGTPHDFGRLAQTAAPRTATKRRIAPGPPAHHPARSRAGAREPARPHPARADTRSSRLHQPAHSPAPHGLQRSCGPTRYPPTWTRPTTATRTHLDRTEDHGRHARTESRISSRS
jgi:hypothetical protein